MKRAVFLPLVPLVATASLGYGICASAGAARSYHSQFCSSLKPAVKAAQQMDGILAGMRSHTVAKTRSQLLTAISTILSTDSSIKVQLHSAPAKVQSSFRWDYLTEGRVKAALGQAGTKRQIQAAMAELDGSIALASKRGTFHPLHPVSMRGPSGPHWFRHNPLSIGPRNCRTALVRQMCGNAAASRACP